MPEFQCNSSNNIPGIPKEVPSPACHEKNMRMANGMTTEVAAHSKSIELVRAAELHCRAFLIHSGHVSFEKLVKDLSPPLVQLLWALIEFYAVKNALAHLHLLMRFVKISSGCWLTCRSALRRCWIEFERMPLVSWIALSFRITFWVRHLGQAVWWPCVQEVV